MPLQTWDDADRALRELGEAQIKISRIKGEADLAINKIEAERNRRKAGAEEIVKSRTKDIEAFCFQNKHEFTKIRTRKLTFGSLSFSVSNNVEYENEDTTIEALESMGFTDCVKVTKNVIKSALKKLDINKLSRVGARKVNTDKLTIKPNIELLKKELMP